MFILPAVYVAATQPSAHVIITTVLLELPLLCLRLNKGTATRNMRVGVCGSDIVMNEDAIAGYWLACN